MPVFTSVFFTLPSFCRTKITSSSSSLATRLLSLSWFSRSGLFFFCSFFLSSMLLSLPLTLADTALIGTATTLSCLFVFTPALAFMPGRKINFFEFFIIVGIHFYIGAIANIYFYNIIFPNIHSYLHYAHIRYSHHFGPHVKTITRHPFSFFY